MLKTVIENKLCCRKSKKKKRENGFDQGRAADQNKKKGAQTCEKTTDPTKTARFKGKMQTLTDKS